MAAAAGAGEESVHPDQLAYDHEARETHPFFGRIRKDDARKLRAMDVARIESAKRGTLPIFAMDVPNPDDNPSLIGVKYFFVASYASFLDYYVGLREDERRVYEIARVLPTRFYVDVDVERAENLDITEEVFIEKRDILIAAVREELALLAGMHPDNVNGSTDNIGEVVILDSTRPSKFSQHLVFPNAVLRNPFHCGALIRRIRWRLTKEHETAPGIGDSQDSHPFFIWCRIKDRSAPGSTKLVRGFFADLMVYTFDRNFRVVGSRKNFTGARPLCEEHATSDSLDVQVLNKTLLQRVPRSIPIYDCLEMDGTMPMSTNDANYLRSGPSSATIPPGRLIKASKSTHVPFNQHASASEKTTTRIPDETMRAFWEEQYPFDILWSLSSGTDKREFNFVNEKGMWHRGRFFSSAELLKEAVLETLPQQIHLGPVKDSLSLSNPTLTFDVDIHDYAGYRPCCKDEKKACATCWPIMTFAQLALKAYCEEMGLGTPLFFFSGSKGIHAWFPSDSEAAKEVALNADARSALLDDFASFYMSDTSERDGAIPIPEYEAMTHRTCVSAAIGSKRETWVSFLSDTMQLSTMMDRHTHVYGSRAADSAIVHCLWPRLDAAVTRDVGHPIKAPFCKHPRSGRCARWLPDPWTNPFLDEDFDKDTNKCIEDLRLRLNLC